MMRRARQLLARRLNTVVNQRLTLEGVHGLGWLPRDHDHKNRRSD
jgi:hypothetical protein